MNAVDGLILRVPFDGSVDVSRTIQYLAPRSIPGVEAVSEQTYQRTINHGGQPGVVMVRDSGKNHLHVTLHSVTGPTRDIVQRVRSLFDLDPNGRAEEHLRKDQIIGPQVRKQPGLRSPGAWDPFETGVRIIIGQQVSVAGASTLTGRLAARFGTKIDHPLSPTLTHLFPSVQQIANSALGDLNMPKARVRTIENFAKALSQGNLDLTSSNSLELSLKQLQSIPGIGPWTSNFIAARVMRYPDAFPAGDLGLRKSAAKLLGKTSPLSEKELSKMAESWRPFRAFAATHLWASLS